MSDDPGLLEGVTIKSAAKRGRPGYDQEAVLAVAVDVFNRHGYDATSMGMLADALGISKSGIYHHVPSKLELLRRALDDALSALEKATDRAEAFSLNPPGLPSHDDDDAASPSASIEALLRGTVLVLLEKQPSVRLLLRLRGNSEVELEAIERRRAVDQRTADLIRDAQEAGEIRGDVDAKELTRLMFGMINSIVEWHKPGGKRTADELADTVVRVLLDGIRNPSAG